MSRKDKGQPHIDLKKESGSPADKTDELSFMNFTLSTHTKRNPDADKLRAELGNMKISDFSKFKNEPEAREAKKNDNNCASAEAYTDAADSNESIEPTQESVQETAHKASQEPQKPQSKTSQETAQEAPHKMPQKPQNKTPQETAQEAPHEVPQKPQGKTPQEPAHEASQEPQKPQNKTSQETAQETQQESLSKTPQKESTEMSSEEMPEVTLPADTTVISEERKKQEAPSDSQSDVQKGADKKHININDGTDLKHTESDTSDNRTHKTAYDASDIEIKVVSWGRHKQDKTVSTAANPHKDTDVKKETDVEVSFCDFRHITPRKIQKPYTRHGTSNAESNSEPGTEQGTSDSEKNASENISSASGAARGDMRAYSRRRASEYSKKKLVRIAKEAGITAGIFIVIFFTMVTFNIYVHRKNQVFGHSMEPTLNEGDTVYTTMLSYMFSEPQIGDIVIVDRSLNEDNEGYFHMFSQVIKRNAITTFILGEENIVLDTCWIKRVVGVAGDIISFKDGKFYRNGELISEDYILTSDVLTYPKDTTVVVPDGCVYVMGDNRNASKDSRDETVGPIPLYQIVGKMWKNS